MEHGGGGGENVGRERGAVPRLLVAVSPQRRRDFRPAGVALSRCRGSGAVGKDRAGAVYHDHPAAYLGRRGLHERAQLPPPGAVEQVRDGRRDDAGLAGCLRLDLGINAVAQTEPERHPEGHERQQQHVGEGEQQSCSQAQRSALRSGETEPDAPDRVNEARGARIVAQLLAQPADMRVERLGRAEPVRVPHL